MEEISGFLIPLLIIIFGLLGMFSKKDKENGDGKPVLQQNPSPVAGQPDGEEDEQETSSISMERTGTDKEKAADEIGGKNKAMEVKQDDVSQRKRKSLPATKRPVHSPVPRHSSTRELGVRSNLTREGLANSVIMAEVLGPPKAAVARRQRAGSFKK